MRGKKDIRQILICPHSGLGNQIGNYVFGRYLIEAGIFREFEVKFLITKDKDLDREFMLDKFQTVLNTPSLDDIQAFLNAGAGFLEYKVFINNIFFNRKAYFNSLYKILARIRTEYALFPPKSPSFLSKAVSYKDVLKYNLLSNVTVSDCYSPIKEFNNPVFKKKIKEEFKLKEPLNKENEEVLKKIKTYKNSVGIHIRRGDFIDMKIPTVTKEYLIKNIEHIKQELNNNDIHFFVFSNGMDWAKENLSNIENVDFIEINNEDKGYLDFILMHHTRHRIYSPSSFSTWLRYLNPYENSIEIIPKDKDREV